MNDMLQGKWLQLRGEAKKAWGKLTDDEWTEMEGNFDKLVGKIQEKYGYSKERAQQEVDRFKMDMNSKYGKESSKL